MPVVDTNVIIHGRGEILGEIIIIPEILQEAESDGAKNVLRNLDYNVKEPGEEAVKEVRNKSEDINSPTSKVDEELLALALERSIPLITDDKALQNLALHTGVEFRGFMDDPIEEKFRWEKRCSNCGNEVSNPPCSQCGSRQIDRKQVRCS